MTESGQLPVNIMKMEVTPIGKAWKKISGAYRRHSGLEVHKVRLRSSNGNLLASLFPNVIGERISKLVL